jgi:DNA anti-recombination protein RmuC
MAYEEAMDAAIEEMNQELEPVVKEISNSSQNEIDQVKDEEIEKFKKESNDTEHSR